MTLWMTPSTTGWSLDDHPDASFHAAQFTTPGDVTDKLKAASADLQVEAALGLITVTPPVAPQTRRELTVRF
ncbi:MAG: hypothetical protein ACRYG4_20635 [Janthinobacterium lividum]